MSIHAHFTDIEDKITKEFQKPDILEMPTNT